MNEFQLLTAGVSFRRGRKSRDVHFSTSKTFENDLCVKHGNSSGLNFFGEPRAPTRVKRKASISANDKLPKKRAHPDDQNIGDQQNEERGRQNDEYKGWFRSQDEVNRFRKKNRIYTYSCSTTQKDKISGATRSQQETTSSALSRIPWPIKSWEDLIAHYHVPAWIIDNILKTFQFKIPSRYAMGLNHALSIILL